MCSDKDVVGSLALLSRVVDRIVFVTARGSLRPLPALEALQRIQKEQERLVQLEGTEEGRLRWFGCFFLSGSNMLPVRPSLRRGRIGFISPFQATVHYLNLAIE